MCPLDCVCVFVCVYVCLCACVCACMCVHVDHVRTTHQKCVRTLDYIKYWISWRIRGACFINSLHSKTWIEWSEAAGLALRLRRTQVSHPNMYLHHDSKNSLHRVFEWSEKTRFIQFKFLNEVSFWNHDANTCADVRLVFGQDGVQVLLPKIEHTHNPTHTPIHDHTLTHTRIHSYTLAYSYMHTHSYLRTQVDSVDGVQILLHQTKHLHPLIHAHTLIHTLTHSYILSHNQTHPHTLTY